MIFEIPQDEILKLTLRQIDHMFVVTPADRILIETHFNGVIERCNRCFEKSPNKYYKRNDEVYFNPFHSGQYMTYLYFLANSIYRNEGANTTCDKLYYLNKTLNGIDLFYAVELPAFFVAEHPIGTVIGRAKFGDGFYFMQNCTVGGVERAGLPELYPVLGNYVAIYAGASIIGDCQIGDNVNIAAGALVKNQNIPDNVNVFGQSPNLIIKPRK